MNKTVKGLLVFSACALFFAGALATGSETKTNDEEFAENDLKQVIDGETSVDSGEYAVSTANEIATMVASDVLDKGGNAVDAAIACAYVLNVVEPYGSGIGGSGGMLIYDSDIGQYTFLDYYAMAAPSGTAENNIGVPGFVSGMEKAHELYGSLPMEDLMSYAVDLARNGITVTSELAYRISSYEAYMDEVECYRNIEEGDTLVQAELADTLEDIAEHGAETFYTGSIAKDIIASTGFTETDLSGYETDIDDPIVSKVDGYEIASAPAPFSGITVIQLLRMIEMADLPNPDEDPQGFIDGFAKIRMAVGSDRYDNVYDTSGIDSVINYNEMLSAEHLQNMIDAEGLEYDTESESTDTTHVSIVDQNGMAVSMTNTLSNFWGAKVYVDGFFLNNSLNNFSGGVNNYEPGKRPRTFTAPTILRKTDGTIMAVGSPGGNVIPDVISTVLSDVLFYDTDPQSAVEKQRIVVRGYDSVMAEENLGTDSFLDIEKINGYDIIRNDSNRKFGSVNIAGYDGQNYYAVSDPHRNGYGYVSNQTE